MTLNDLITELQKLQPKYGAHRVHDWQLALLGQGYLTTFGFNDYEHRHQPPEPPPLVAVGMQAEDHSQ